jgi:hypothetical protein
MRKLIALLTVVVLLLSWPVAGFGATQDEILERVQFLGQQIAEMESASVYSNVYVDSIWTDLNSLPTTGSVTSYVYRGGDPTPTLNSFTTPPRSINSGIDKMTRYILGNVANTYRQEPFNTEMTMKTFERTTVPTYVYGDYKSQAIDEIILGLPNCFDISYNTSSGRSVPTKPIVMPVAEATLKAIFAIDSTTYTITDSSTDEPKTTTMDVAPEIIGDRTFVPVRYLAYSLGVEESGVTWDDKTKTVGITKDDAVISLTIGSATASVNGEPVQMDVAPYIKEIETGGRTMLPARWVAEPLGATVSWNQESREMVIELPQDQGPDQE